MSAGLRLAGVFAHPDDDTHAIGGTLALHPEVATMLVVATSGEAGLIVDPTAATRETLGSVREEEERAALRALGRDDVEVRWLRHPDGRLAGVDRAVLVDEVSAALGEFRPHVVITFGPDGITRHQDHVAAHEAGTEAFHRAREEARRGGDDRSLRRLYHHVLPRSWIEEYLERRRALGEEVDPDAPFMPRGVPDETITVMSNVEAAAERKLSALRAHRTQPTPATTLPEELARRWASTEFLSQAWPAPDPPDLRLSGPFEGLD